MILNILSDVFSGILTFDLFHRFVTFGHQCDIWWNHQYFLGKGNLQIMGLNFTTTSGVCHSWTKNTFVNGVFSSIPSTFLGNSQCQTLFVAERNVAEYQVKKEKMYLRNCGRKISPSTKINPSAGSKSLNLGWSFFSPNFVILRYAVHKTEMGDLVMMFIDRVAGWLENIAKDTTDPRVEQNKQVQTQILIKFHLQNLDQASTSKS